MLNELTDESFEQEVLKSELPVLVDFWAPWCGPCKVVSPVIEKLENDYDGRIKFCKMNVDGAQKTASQYGIMSIPTLIFFKNGEKVEQIIGAVPEPAIKEKLDSLL